MKGIYLLTTIVFITGFFNANSPCHVTRFSEFKLNTRLMKNEPDTMKSKVSGEGRPLILVGGGLTGWSSWEPFVDIFTANHRKVILVQLLNVQYGLEIRNLPPDYSVKTESGALAATLNSLGLSEPLDIVAWSYGSLITLDYAMDHPESIRTLTLIEPPAFWALYDIGEIDQETQQTLDFLETMHGNISEDMLADFIREAGLVKEGQRPQDLPFWSNWVKHRQSLRNNNAILSHRDALERLKAVKAPVLFITGTGSPGYYPHIEKVLSSYLPDARILELDGAHAAHIVSRDRFLDELEKFQKMSKN